MTAAAKRALDEIFAHGIGRADLLNGMVRLELLTLVPGTDGAPSSEPQRVLWLPLEGFLRSAATIEGFVGELRKAGVVRAAPHAAAGAPAPAVLSPNFPAE
jgi:hypothetical protein